MAARSSPQSLSTRSVAGANASSPPAEFPPSRSALWPRAPPKTFEEFDKDLDIDNVRYILTDATLSSSKFRLVRKLRDLVNVEPQAVKELVSKSGFWILKGCIPNDDQLQMEEIDAFVKLLAITAGQIESISDDTSASRSRRSLNTFVCWEPWTVLRGKMFQAKVGVLPMEMLRPRAAARCGRNKAQSIRGKAGRRGGYDEAFFLRRVQKRPADNFPSGPPSRSRFP